MIENRPPKIILALTAMTFTLGLEAQTNTQFVPNGKPVVLVYSDVASTYTRDDNAKSFDVTRAYLGYEYNFTSKLYSRVCLDVADPGAGKLQMTAILKYAYLQYKGEKFSARFGMIGTDQYSLQEKIWGYRYIFKSFQDAYLMGPSADLGASLEYSPFKFISVDFSMLNGEGYKRIQADSTFKTSFGITVRPVKGLALRAYYDMMDHNFNQKTLSLFAGYTIKTFRAGIEYNTQNNNGMVNEQNFSGWSVYSSLGLAKKFSVFARYDNLSSEVIEGETLPWNLVRDGQLFMAGFDYAPVNGIRLSPNFRGWSPRDDSKPFASTVSLNLEIKF